MTYCITAELADIRTCTLRGQHLVSCNGLEYRWSGETWEVGEWVATGRPCGGCQPREAQHGMLCWACWQDVEDAENAYYPLVDLLTTHDKLLTADTGGVRTATTSGVPIPGTALALDEIDSYRRHHTGDTATWVATTWGGAEAVHFARVVKGALRSFPSEDKERKITRTRCPKCEMLTLLWTPPRFAADLVKVRCMNAECGFELDQTSFEIVAGDGVYDAGMRDQIKADRAVHSATHAVRA